MEMYLCSNCGSLQYPEDLGRTVERFDEPAYNVCGFCKTDDIVEANAYEFLEEIVESAIHALKPGPHKARNVERLRAMAEYIEMEMER